MKNLIELKAKIENYIEKNQGNICLSYYDIDEGEGFSIKGEEKVPSASMIKLLIMATLLKEVREGKISLEEKIKISKDDYCGGSGILKELDPGHILTIKELMTLMIIVSDNLATNILIKLLGMEKIKEMGSELRLKNTSLERKMMDGEAKSLGKDNFTSANDIKNILKLVYRKELVDEKSSDLMLEILLRQHERERLQRFLGEEVKIANKSGDLDFLENDGGIFFLEHKTYILVILVNRASSNYEAKEIIGKISKFIYEEMEKANGK